MHRVRSSIKRANTLINLHTPRIFPNTLALPIENISIRERKLCLVCAILSRMVYEHSTEVFDDALLINLGLTLRYSYTTKIESGDARNTADGVDIKCMVFAKATPSELQELTQIYWEAHPNRVPASTSEWYSTKRKRKYAPPFWTPQFIQWIQHLGIEKTITPQHLFVVFRGTDNSRNILTDIRASVSVDNQILPGIQAHTGFLQAFRNIYARLANVLHIYAERRSVVCTGHSMGGALANLLAFRLASEHLKGGKSWSPSQNIDGRIYYVGRNVPSQWSPSLGLITFGAPRVITRSVVQDICPRYMSTDSSYLGFHLRIANDKDKVTQLPFPKLNPTNTNPYVHLPLRRIDIEPARCHEELQQEAYISVGQSTSDEPHNMGNYIINIFHTITDSQAYNVKLQQAFPHRHSMYEEQNKGLQDQDNFDSWFETQLRRTR